MTKKITLWEKWYYVATFIIAVVALVGLGFSIRSSNELSKRLEDITGAAYDVTVPVLKFAGLGFGTKSNEISCDEPFHTVFLVFKNYSLTPLQITKLDYDIVIGDIPIHQFQSDPEFEGPEVIPPGETKGLRVNNTEFVKFYGAPGLHTSIIKADVYYEKLHTRQKFNLKYEAKILTDCSKPLEGRNIPLKETISRVSD